MWPHSNLSKRIYSVLPWQHDMNYCPMNIFHIENEENNIDALCTCSLRQFDLVQYHYAIYMLQTITIIQQLLTENTRWAKNDLLLKVCNLVSLQPKYMTMTHKGILHSEP